LGSEQLADDGQREARSSADAGEAVPQIVEPQVSGAGLLTLRPSVTLASMRAPWLPLSGIASAVGGVLLIIGWSLNIGRDSLLGSVLLFIAYVLCVFAVVGLFSVQVERVGGLGLAGFVLLVFGNIVFASILFVDIARNSGLLEDLDYQTLQENGATQVIVIAGGAALMFGCLVFGLSTLRAAVFSRWAAVLLIVAGLMPLVSPLIGTQKMLARISGIALIGLGIDLLRRRIAPRP
jgi:hypothetical protein